MGWILLIAGAISGWRSGYFDPYALAALAIFAAFLVALSSFLVLGAIGNAFDIDTSLSFDLVVALAKDWLINCAFAAVGLAFGAWLKKKQVRDFGE